jgi:hypothetical protein
MRAAGAISVLLCTAVLAAAAWSTGGSRLSEKGVSGLLLGRPLAQIKADHLIKPTTPGCELASPRPIAARLRAPFDGFATFNGASPHRLQALAILGGTKTSRGIAIGDPAAKVLSAYPTAKVNNSRPGDPLQFTAIVVRSGGRDRMWFLLDRAGGKVTELDVPAPQFCE